MLQHHDPPELAQPASSDASAPAESASASDPLAAAISESELSRNTVTAQPDGFVGTTLDERYYIEKKLGHGGVGAEVIKAISHQPLAFSFQLVVKDALQLYIQSFNYSDS